MDSPCLDCGQTLHVEIRDGQIVAAEPDTIVGYVDLPFSKWAEDWPYT